MCGKGGKLECDHITPMQREPGHPPQHRVPHSVKWTSFAPPGWTNFAPPLTFSLVRFFDPDCAIAGPVIPFDNLPTCRTAVAAWEFLELAGNTAPLYPGVIVALFRRIVIGNTECFQRVFVVQFMILPG